MKKKKKPCNYPAIPKEICQLQFLDKHNNQASIWCIMLWMFHSPLVCLPPTPTGIPTKSERFHSMGQDVTLFTIPNAECTEEHKVYTVGSSLLTTRLYSLLVKNTVDLSPNYVLMRSHFQNFKGENTWSKTYSEFSLKTFL